MYISFQRYEHIMTLCGFLSQGSLSDVIMYKGGELSWGKTAPSGGNNTLSLQIFAFIFFFLGHLERCLLSNIGCICTMELQ